MEPVLYWNQHCLSGKGTTDRPYLPPTWCHTEFCTLTAGRCDSGLLQVFVITQVKLMKVKHFEACRPSEGECEADMLLVVVSFLLVHTAGSWNQARNQLNVTLNETLQENSLFSGRFGFRDLAGVRSFVPEQEMETRIIGGQEAWAHSWPWQVSLQLDSMPACGGAIISPLWVTSAAHCFIRHTKASLWTVLAGKHDLDNPEEPQQQLVGVSMILTHHSYNTQSKESDVALLKLEKPLEFNHFVRPIDIWMTPLPLLMKCTITGWGSTRENGPRVNRLQEVNVTILPSDDCNQYYLGRIRPSMFCAGKDEGGVDACQGDSGGPLSCFTGTRYELAGLVSWGVGCGRAKRPGVYTRVQEHAQWMSDTMDNQAKVYEDDLTVDEDCGKQQSSGCDQTPGLAGLSLSADGVLSVVNVTESCPFFWPWQVSLQFNGRHYCSGALIHPHWVITAKHCGVRAKEDVAVLGLHDMKFLPVQTILIDKVFNPPQKAGFPPKSDLALLHLSVAARLGSEVSPVCVPEEDNSLDDTWSCITAGWGATKAKDGVDPDRLHHAGLTLVNESTCRHKWGGFITDTHICSHPAGSTSCMGDSGAPLFCQKHGTYFLFGVVTWGSWHCDSEKPAIFTSVSDYQSWINKMIIKF